ncbi:hypothetical protein WICMUC_003703 [Wickerhamomyces mucosus]|uniref:Uncharacterized protein n=1 Tax=Wickerhamomyces mucosus TaxID=1378264 RepID=A0A9P8PJK3_9ASCO|nr:hypothetical protein WICMUC_003703 [Wickerhamomyces mucosus]
MQFSTLFTIASSLFTLSQARKVQLYVTSEDFLEDGIFLKGLTAVHEGAGFDFALADFGTNYTVFNYFENNGTLSRTTTINIDQEVEWPLSVAESFNYPYLSVGVIGSEANWTIADDGQLKSVDGLNFYLAQNTSDPYNYTGYDKWAVGAALNTSEFEGKVGNLRKAGIYARDVYHFP